MDIEMLVCDVEEFQASYLPFIPAEEGVTAYVTRLKNAGLLVLSADDNGLQWSDFPNSPSKLKANEAALFSVFEKIAKELANYTFSSTDSDGRLAKAHLQYRDCPNTNLASELEGANFGIDGCFELNNASRLWSGSEKLVAPDTVVVAEYKKHEKHTLDVRHSLSFIRIHSDLLSESLEAGFCSKPYHERRSSAHVHVRGRCPGSKLPQ